MSFKNPNKLKKKKQPVKNSDQQSKKSCIQSDNKNPKTSKK